MSEMMMKREAPPDARENAALVKKPRLAYDPTGDEDVVAVTGAREVLLGIRDRLMATADAHLQAQLLLQYSHVAISPDAETDAAIDFLFSFLQQHQAGGSSSAGGASAANATGAEGSKNDGAIVVGAIVRGLRRLLWVKTKVVQPMIQVDAMGEQLMQSVSVTEDFKLRRDMLRIVVDCWLISKQFRHVETLINTCIKDHDAVIQSVCLRSYLRLYTLGYELEAAPTELFDCFARNVLHGRTPEIRVLAARLVSVLGNAHPQALIKTRFVPDASLTKRQPLTLSEKAFFVLSMAGNDVASSVRQEVALCLRECARIPVGVLECALAKTQIDEELVHVQMKSVMMLSSGVLLSLLEDRDVEVALESTRTIHSLCTSVSTWSEQVLDRVITAHFDALPQFSDSKEHALNLFQTLSCLLQKRKDQYKSEYSMSREELDYVLHTAEELSGNRVMLSLLSVLLLCELSSTWMVQRIVDYAIYVATIHGSGKDDATDKAFHSCMVDVAKEFAVKCGSILQIDTGLHDKLVEQAGKQGNQLKKELCEVLMLVTRDSKQLVHEDATESQSLDTTAFPFKISQLKIKETSVHERLASLLEPPTTENLALCLKSVRRLQTAGELAQEPYYPKILGILLQLKQFVLPLPDTASTSSSGDVSMDSMLNNQASHPETNAAEFARLNLSRAIMLSCQELVTLSTDLYAKHYALSCNSRANLLQLILLGRMGLVIAELQTSDEFRTQIQWLANESAKLNFLFAGRSMAHVDTWFSNHLLRDIATINDLKREFVHVTRAAWPRALIEAASEESQSPSSRLATAQILEPRNNETEPLEITAQWPFEVRVRCLVDNVKDITTIYVKSVLPSGQTHYHQVPLAKVSYKTPTRYSIDHSISLNISPFSDPTSFAISVCIKYPGLPAALEKKTSVGTSDAYTEISSPVRTAIFHRANSTIRPASRSAA